MTAVRPPSLDWEPGCRKASPSTCLEPLVLGFVVTATKPTNIHRPVIVIMVRFGVRVAAFFARHLDDEAALNSRAEALVRPGLFWVRLPPRMLAWVLQLIRLLIHARALPDRLGRRPSSPAKRLLRSDAEDARLEAERIFR
jgi:hypothetical protein